jgi:hypothetical protein
MTKEDNQLWLEMQKHFPEWVRDIYYEHLVGKIGDYVFTSADCYLTASVDFDCIRSQIVAEYLMRKKQL